MNGNFYIVFILFYSKSFAVDLELRQINDIRSCIDHDDLEVIEGSKIEFCVEHIGTAIVGDILTVNSAARRRRDRIRTISTTIYLPRPFFERNNVSPAVIS